MGLECALDELYATGWSALDTAGCSRADDGRWIPHVNRIRSECQAEGFTLDIKHVQLFDCYRGEWAASDGAVQGAVVAQSEHEAAIHALAHIRRSAVPA